MSPFTQYPSNTEKINAALTKVLSESGLSPYVKGDTKKITALLKNTGLKLASLSHEEDRTFHAKTTVVEYYLLDKNGNYAVDEDGFHDFGYFEYNWG